MMKMTELANKKVLVVGLGKSGFSVCRFLHSQSIAFDVVDEGLKDADVDKLNVFAPQANCSHEFTETLFCQYEILIMSPGIALSHSAVQSALQKGAQAIGDIELFAYAVDAPVLAVTGSNGKSTVVAWLQAVLESAGVSAVACGNIGLPALDALQSGIDIYVVELSSFQLETTNSLKLLSASVLNVSEDHMNRYQDLEHYAATKRRIYRHAELAVCNAHDERTHVLATDESQAVSLTPPRILFAVDSVTQGDVGTRDYAGQTWLQWGEKRIMPVCELPLPGLHNCENAQAVLAMLSPLSLSAETLKAGLLSFKGLPHRTQFVHESQGVRWFNDSKGTNIDACCRAIEAMQAPVVLIAGGQGKDADFSQLGPVVQEHVKAIVLIGEDADVLNQALQDFAQITKAKTMLDAVTQAMRIATAGDVVLLSPACASFDMFDSFEHRGDVFVEAVMKVAA